MDHSDRTQMKNREGVKFAALFLGLGGLATIVLACQWPQRWLFAGAALGGTAMAGSAACAWSLRRRGGAANGSHSESRQGFEAAIPATHDAIMETDWQGIREVNDTFCQMTGFSRAELVGVRAPYPFWPAEEYARIAAALETSMRGQAREFELVLNRRNGERFPVLLAVSRFVQGKKGAPNRIVYSFRDLSELKKAETLVRGGKTLAAW